MINNLYFFLIEDGEDKTEIVIGRRNPKSLKHHTQLVVDDGN
jgi:hypothetical protein